MPPVPEDEEIEINLGSPCGGKEGMRYMSVRTCPLNVEADMATVEAIQHQEDQEFDALVSLLEESHPATGNNDLAEYGSDDDDFAWMFMEVIAAADAKLVEKSPDSLLAPSDDMDTSVG